jgi:hypothetical protein
MSIFGPRFSTRGSWSLHSDIDPRWNCSGSTNTNAFFGTPPETDAKLRELSAKYGKKPKDLTFSFMKD